MSTAPVGPPGLANGPDALPGDSNVLDAAQHRLHVHILIARFASALVAVVAAVALYGWAAQRESLRTFGHPARVSMNPMSAVTFILASAAMQVLLLRSTPRRRLVVDLLAALTLAVGLVQILAALGLPLRVDHLLFSRQLGRSDLPLNLAVIFVLLGSSILLLDRAFAKIHPAPWLVLGSLAISLVTLLGYAYDIAPLYGTGSFITMALNSAICAYALSLGILAARPHLPPLSTVLSDTAGGLISRRLLPTAVVLPTLAGFASLYVGRRTPVGFELAILLFTVTTLVVFVALTTWTADRIGRLDVDNRHTVERLRSAEAVYHSLVETLPQNIFRKDAQGRFTFGNRNFCATLGKPLDELVGKTDFDFYGPELAARYRHDDLDVARGGTARDVVEEHVTPAGDRLYVQVIKTPVKSADGGVAGVQGIFWDVTDRVVAQRELEQKNAALQEANARLEQFNAQLEQANWQLEQANTRQEVANVRLNQANTQLEQAVRSEREATEQLRKTQTHLVQSEKMVGLGQMVAGVAHEINNPLAFVSNNVAVLQRDVSALGNLIDLYRQADELLKSDRPELAAAIADLAEVIDLAYTRQNLDELLGRSREGLRRIQQIVRDLRDFVRLDENDLQEADLNIGVSSTLNIIAGHAKKRQIRLEAELSPLPLVTCYPAKINQVIMNLVGNAIDASREQGQVTIRSSPLGEPPTSVRLEVQDEGCGIPPEVAGRIFDPFFTTKPVGQGTGLGLSISYGIVRDHDGTIEVNSEPDKGTTFIVTLPIAGPKDRKSGSGPSQTD